jgi:hypothetical protein
MLKLGLFYIIYDLKLSKMTLKDLGSQALVSWNICYKQQISDKFGNMSLDGRTKQQQLCSPKIFQRAQKELYFVGVFFSIVLSKHDQQKKTPTLEC